jgi:hypothetical protein
MIILIAMLISEVGGSPFDMDRDCGTNGSRRCIVTGIADYIVRASDSSLSLWITRESMCSRLSLSRPVLTLDSFGSPTDRRIGKLQDIRFLRARNILVFIHRNELMDNSSPPIVADQHRDSTHLLIEHSVYIGGITPGVGKHLDRVHQRGHDMHCEELLCHRSGDI